MWLQSSIHCAHAHHARHHDGLEHKVAPSSSCSWAICSLPEDLHGGLCVWIVGRLEAQLLQAKPVKEHLQGAYEVSQRQAFITHYTCNCTAFACCTVWPTGWCTSREQGIKLVHLML